MADVVERPADRLPGGGGPMESRSAAAVRREGIAAPPSRGSEPDDGSPWRSRRIYLALLLLCVASRLASTIYYIEDPDSLRFALSLQEYSIPALQPHFPGYPVFAFLGKILYLTVGSFAVSFSLLGAVAVFGIVFYLLRILDLEPDSLRGALVAGLVFFNPLVWLMSNRYMPDLLGLACALGAFYHLAVNRQPVVKQQPVVDGQVLDGQVVDRPLADGRRRHRAAGFFGAGLLAGLRLSYLPFLLPPVLVALVREKEERLRGIAWGLAGVLVWLVPLVAVTGPQELLEAALRQTRGHFGDFGGTVLTEPDGWARALGLVEGVWADGLGGYWRGRHPLTLAVSAAVLGLLPAGLRAAGSWLRGKTGRVVDRRLGLLMAASWGTYLVWIALYQNVIYKSRHVLPLLPFVLAVLALGAAWVVRRRGPGLRAALGAGALAYVAVTGVLVVQHRSPTAIAQVAEHLRERGKALEARPYVFSIPLVNDYLEAVGVNGVYLSAGDPADREALRELAGGGEPARLFTVGEGGLLPGREPLERRTFYHNPHVNRMWSEVEVQEYAVAR